MVMHTCNPSTQEAETGRLGREFKATVGYTMLLRPLCITALQETLSKKKKTIKIKSKTLTTTMEKREPSSNFLLQKQDASENN